MQSPTGIPLTTGREPDLEERFHLIGIGGAGMSALARWLADLGATVSGSDLMESPTLSELRARGVRAYAPHDPAQMGDPTWVVVSDAVHPDNPEVIEAMRRGLPIWRRSQLMGWLLKPYRVIAVSGTHGKTTTTAMLATILEEAGYDPLVLLGGDMPAAQPPWAGNIRLGKGEWAVVEACEAYEAFLDLEPEIALITNVDPDHLDYHGTFERLQQSFARFCQRVRVGGHQVCCGDNRGVHEVCKRLHARGAHERPPLLYGFGEGNDLRAEILQRTPDGTDFELATGNWRMANGARFHLPLAGDHNVQNALGAIAAALLLDIPIEVQQRALARFRGVKRRQELIGEAAGITLVDDYAHHPIEIEATIAALRQRFPNRRLVVIYQPHLYSRTRDQLKGLIRSLSAADAVVITDIYPAREKPIPGVSASLIADGLLEGELPGEPPPTLYVPIKEQVPHRLLPHLVPGDVVVTMGAGDIDRVAPVLLRMLEARGQVRRLRIAVLMGGDSPERDVSLLSGMRVLQALDPERFIAIPVDPALMRGKEGVWGLLDLLQNERPDLAFIALHGRHGEDGAIQGLLEMLGIPYTGSGILPSALAMNKYAAKIVLQSVGLTVPPGVLVCQSDLLEPSDLSEIPGLSRLNLPLIVKPNEGGSTLGTTRVWEWEQLPRALRKAFAYDERALIEELIEGVEVSVPVIGTRAPQALPPIEIVPRTGFYGFEAKYTPGLTEEIVPARLPDEMLELLKATALHAHLALGCRSMSRVDIILRDFTPFILEVNTVPGLTPTSLLPRSAEAAGIPFPQLITRIIEDALEGWQ
ncbi:MAG: UDP-N-acetylmuramate--L-alanine ligase [Fimbriimonadales bacterium]|nr:UDP-N-acetylmuramate--L-alanine ligase [Fimbriimonadales bacterium]